MTDLVDGGLFEQLYRNAPCGLLSTSPDGRIIEVNDTLIAWLDVSRERLVGSAFLTLLDAGSRMFYETRHVPVLRLQGHIREVALGLQRADGTRLPVLVNSVVDAATGEMRTALFDVTKRHEYERELLLARRSAESSEERVRILQDVSSSFDLTASDEDVADVFVATAREAFAASHAALFLTDEQGELQLIAGTNPLFGLVKPVRVLRETTTVTVVTMERADEEFPEVAAAFRATRVVAMSVTPLLAEQGRLGLLVCCFGRSRAFDDQFEDLQQALGRQASQALVRVRLQAQLASLALRDQLTGLANRQLLHEELSRSIAAAEESSTPVAVIFLDLDGFKAVNDHLGHRAGDDVLRQVADRLRAAVRDGDLAARIGGDEFVVVCKTADGAAAESIAQRVRSSVGRPFVGVPETLAVTASVGVSVYYPDRMAMPTHDELLGLADEGMYRSKGSGKDRVTVVSARS